MRITLIALVLLAACNHDAPPAEQGSASAPGSATVVEQAPLPSTDDSPASKTLPGAGLPGGIRGEPKAGAAKLSDLGVDATWPDDLKVRWLSDQAVLVTLEKQPIMLAKIATPSPAPPDGEVQQRTEDNITTVTCDRTLRGSTYHFEVRSPNELAARSLGPLCKALR